MFGLAISLFEYISHHVQTRLCRKCSRPPER